MKLESRTRGNHSVLISNFRLNAIEIGFDTKNSTFVLFLCVFVGPVLNKKVTRATKKGLSNVRKFQNLANTYLR